jgi:hypothetical protein
VTALLVELAEMRREDEGAKAVVFSAWGRLLKLVGEALSANGLQHVSLAGAQPHARAAALRRFLTDRDCAIILIVLSTGGPPIVALAACQDRPVAVRHFVLPAFRTVLFSVDFLSQAGLSRAVWRARHSCEALGFRACMIRLKISLVMLSGGAAGLTLTVANAVYLMEPALNPGLEAQAAARIHRLGEANGLRFSCIEHPSFSYSCYYCTLQTLS